MGSVKGALEAFLLVSAVATALVTWVTVIRPKVRKRVAEREAVNEVLLGRDEVPANSITGEPAKPAKPAIGQQVADLAGVVDVLAGVVDGLAQKLGEVHHELHPNNGSSMKDALTRTEAGVKAARTELGEIRDRLAAGDERFDDQANRLGRIEGVLGEELRDAVGAVASATATSRKAVDVLETALLAEPPADMS